MDFQKDYYAILGCAPTADQAVIQAAYRALAKKHHPDANQGSEESKAKFQEIQEAYEVLSDLTKRTYYDSMRAGTGGREYAPGEEPNNAADAENEFIARRWNIIKEYYPQIDLQASELAKISPNLKSIFQSIIIETKDFENSSEIFLAVEGVYITKYFGNNKQINAFASHLLRGFEIPNRKLALLELNQVMVAMGGNAPADKVIKNITDKYLKNYKSSSDIHFYLLENEEAWKFIYGNCDTFGWKLINKKGFIRGAEFRSQLNGNCIEVYSPEEARRELGMPLQAFPSSLIRHKSL